jgi:hypothetical protein
MMVNSVLTALRYARRGVGIKRALKGGHYHVVAGHGVELFGIVLDLVCNTPYGKVVCCVGVGLALVGAWGEREAKSMLE